MSRRLSVPRCAAFARLRRLLAGGGVGATCSTRRRATSAARAREPAQRARARRQRASSRSASAATSSYSDDARQDLAAGDGAGQLRPRRRCTSPTPTHGWAVGHDGVVLHSADGGAHLDARSSTAAAPTRLLVAAHAARGRREPASAERDASCSPRRSASPSRAPTSRSSTSGSPTRTNGFVVGAFNLILRTRDGGKTWEPWFDRTDNPKTAATCTRSAPARRRAVHRRRAGPAAQARRAERPRSARSSCRTRARCSASPAARRAPSRSACAATPSAAPTAARRWQKVDDRPARSASPAARRMRRPHRARQPGGPRPRQRRRRRELQARSRSSGRRRRRRSSAPAPERARPRRPARRPRAAAELAGRAKPWPSEPTRSTACRSSATLARLRPQLRQRGSSGWSSTTASLVRRRLRARSPLRARLVAAHEADAQRQLREDDSAEPAVHQELPRRTARTCAGSATRCASWSRTRDGDIFDPAYLETLQADQRRAVPDARRRPRVGEVAVDAGGALDRGHRGGLPRRPGDARQLRRLAAAPSSSCARTSRAPASSAAWSPTTSSRA